MAEEARAQGRPTAVADPGALVARRSLVIRATQDRIWEEIASKERFAAWWGVETEVMKTAVLRWDAREGGWFENTGTYGGSPINFKGRIVVFDPPREATFEWTAPESGWTEPTYVSVRLRPLEAGTLAEIVHFGWEALGEAGPELHQVFERGWSLAELEALKQRAEANAA